SAMLPPVSRFYLNENHRGDDALQAKLAAADRSRGDVGIMHAGNEATERGGFSLYVPEYYDGSEPMALVVALHGGSGHGRSFLWSWLKDARSRGVIVASPSSREGTWSLMGPDLDSGSLRAIVERVCEHWRVDESRLLLTGMSDGGTFSYLAGLPSDSPFTHLAPIAASFHPMLLEMVDRDRLEGLPIYLTHGALDWMFDIEVARTARDAFTATGADLTYREIDDLSHTYPREENDRILDWLLASPKATDLGLAKSHSFRPSLRRSARHRKGDFLRLVAADVHLRRCRLGHRLVERGHVRRGEVGLEGVLVLPAFGDAQLIRIVEFHRKGVVFAARFRAAGRFHGGNGFLHGGNVLGGRMNADDKYKHWCSSPVCIFVRAPCC
ncbi:MAG: hypothetical protein AAGE43_13015, partial [Pseudomonadota bacterium]